MKLDRQIVTEVVAGINATKGNTFGRRTTLGGIDKLLDVYGDGFTVDGAYKFLDDLVAAAGHVKKVIMLEKARVLKEASKEAEVPAEPEAPPEAEAAVEETAEKDA